MGGRREAFEEIQAIGESFLNIQLPWELWKFTPPTWEAVAGFLAVFAAWRVGRRQLDIQKQQEVIAINQLKMQLLEKRSHCITELKEIEAINNVEGRLADDHWLRLCSVLQSAILIFPKKFSNRVDAAVEAVWLMNFSQKRAEHYGGLSKEDLAKDMQEKVFLYEDRARKALDGLVKELEEATRIDFWG